MNYQEMINCYKKSISDLNYKQASEEISDMEGIPLINPLLVSKEIVLSKISNADGTVVILIPVEKLLDLKFVTSNGERIDLEAISFLKDNGVKELFVSLNKDKSSDEFLVMSGLMHLNEELAFDFSLMINEHVSWRPDVCSLGDDWCVFEAE